MRYIIFTDLDGTLLDLTTYSPEPAREAVAALQRAGVPIVFCSSKTRSEQRAIQIQLGIEGPMIVENGSAVCLPAAGEVGASVPSGGIAGDRRRIFGLAVSRVREKVEELRSCTGLRFSSFWRMPLHQLCRLTGLPPDAALRAQQREYSVTVAGSFSAAEFSQMQQTARALGLKVFPGARFFTLTGAAADKGRAVQWMTNHYRRMYGAVRTVGIGDSANDLPLLAAVDLAYAVQRPDGTWYDFGPMQVKKMAGIGPVGWSLIAEELLQRAGKSRR